MRNREVCIDTEACRNGLKTALPQPIPSMEGHSLAILTLEGEDTNSGCLRQRRGWSPLNYDLLRLIAGRLAALLKIIESNHVVTGD